MIYATLLLVRAIISLVTYLPDSNPTCHFHRHQQANEPHNASLMNMEVEVGWQELSVKEVVRRMILSLVPALVEELTDSVTGGRCFR